MCIQLWSELCSRIRNCTNIAMASNNIMLPLRQLGKLDFVGSKSENPNNIFHVIIFIAFVIFIYLCLGVISVAQSTEVNIITSWVEHRCQHLCDTASSLRTPHLCSHTVHYHPMLQTSKLPISNHGGKYHIIADRQYYFL
jgi:hypothetical protein